MTISLTKRQTISLEKGGQGLSKVFMGLGWDVAQPKKRGGFLGGLLGGGNQEASIDLDASCVAFDGSGHHLETVYFGRLSGLNGAVRHGGDNLTGAGEGDDERIFVNLTQVPGNVQTLVFTVNSFRGQTFDQVENAFCRVVDDTNGQEIARLNLSEQGNHTGMVMVKIVRSGAGWQLTAIGEKLQGRTAQDLVPGLGQYL